MRVSIVLGTQFGDEGKGNFVAYLANYYPHSVVIRFSGGHQAGHTVFDGKTRHVFSTYGSGTLAKVPTFISKHCVFYLPNMVREKRVLESKKINTKNMLFIDPHAMVTTPYDVAFNKTLEKVNHHGSCGIGVGTTMKRHLHSPYKFFAIDLKNESIRRNKLRNIHEYYINLLKEMELLDDYEYFLQENDDYFSFEDYLRISDFEIVDESFLNRFYSLIFEGSQGIMLDMDFGVFPNVTFSNTTSKNAIDIISRLKKAINFYDVYYISRCYQTRHGNGFMTSNDDIILINNEDETNITNEWQGSFRVKELDYDLIKHAIDVDAPFLNQINGFFDKNLVITCLDQRPDFKINLNNFEIEVPNIFLSESPNFNLIKKA